MKKNNTFNDIGIDGSLDWKRILKLMLIGIFAAFMVLTGDMLLLKCLSAVMKPCIITEMLSVRNLNAMYNFQTTLFPNYS